MEEKEIKEGEKNNKKEGYNTRIGPLLKRLFEKQKQIIKKTTWNCTNPSDYEVGEIIAKKMIGKGIL